MLQGKAGSGTYTKLDGDGNPKKWFVKPLACNSCCARLPPRARAHRDQYRDSIVDSFGINLSLDLGRFIAYAPIHVELATRSTTDPTVFTGTKRTFTYSVALVVPEADVLEPFTDVQVGIRWCR